MKPPIIVYDSGDALVFESLDRLIGNIEPSLVFGTEQTCDSEGRLLKLGVEDGWTIVIAIEPPAYQPDKLRHILVNNLANIYSKLPSYSARPRLGRVTKEELEQMPLEDLVTRAMEFKD